MAGETRRGAGLADLLASTGVVLRSAGDGLEGACPRCDSGLRVDPESHRWVCEGGCGSGGPAEWLALNRGVSVHHAEALLRAGWHPKTEDARSGAATTVRLLPSLAAADADDQTLLDAVVAHYQHSLSASDPARAWLVGLGVDETLALRLRIGVADRTLGYRLPEANRKDGARLRTRLTGLGIYRASGHEHLTGCVVVPILDANGAIVGLCGYRLAGTDQPAWAQGLPGGVFNEASSASGELLVCSSVRDAIAVMATGYEQVVAPGRPAGYRRGDVDRLVRCGLRRAIIVEGSDRLAGQLRDAGVEAVVISPGAPPADLLASASDRPAALTSLLASAHVSSRRKPPPVTAVENRGGGDADPVPLAMSASHEPDDRGPGEPAPVQVQVSGDAAELHVAFPIRRWRVRGADRNRVPETLRVALSITDIATGAFHLDTLDLYQAKARSAFLESAASELKANRQALRRELAEVLFATETALADREDSKAIVPMSDAEREAALALLADPGLVNRIVADLGILGVVGEQTNLLVAYLATVSRKCERPFGVVIQSSSAAGKSTLADAVCELVPPEDLVAFSALTGQALYYVGSEQLAHKVLAVAEERGAARAAYALKLLVTEGRLSIASTGKDPATGRLHTRAYEVAGPVALVLTTTDTDLDPELANRVIVLGVDENPAQTRAIHAAQRHAATLEGLVARMRRDEIIALHRNVQRLLEPLPVVISDAEALAFPAHAVRHRRDHQKLLGLIAASAVLHQHQRRRASVTVGGRDVAYIEADAADVELGVRLAEATLATAGDELAPQTRRLLAAAHELAAEKTDASGEGAMVGFTRRELRERLGCTEHQVRIGLARLVALEYVRMLPGAPGCQHRYALTDLPEAAKPGEPGGPGETPREPGEPPSPGGNPSRPAPTANPATRKRNDHTLGTTPPIVPVDIGPDGEPT